ncbi:hypothetical protein HG535_0D02930 [Zygotorulaspora mrakii]|uniref:Mitochondrial intermediate peptidase n=1 Tax=Zygotorulaspora mrakii TaxID=42260 RepID=A0A7H9B1Q4_ZYGMR|nr:uncharacterized protein HG535_0D02930 [Zygotorulaspora mrakii]QLG72585.1 hypothetical protein HG535_0D02930 [Zygotorulaspora mrakii]
MLKSTFSRNVTGIKNLWNSGYHARFFATEALPYTSFGASHKANGQLRRTFDDLDYWHDANRDNFTAKTVKGKVLSNLTFGGQSQSNAGLFRNPYLKSPDGLRKFSRHSLMQAESALEDMRSDHSKEGLLKYIMRLDQLSDTLCRVIDLCEFIRSSHPDNSYLEAAQACHEEMFEFMNVLNTDVALCDTLKSVLSNTEISSRLSEEEIKVGKLLLEDFEKSGIRMEPDIREQFIALSQQISVVGQDFINNTDYVQSNYLKIKCEDLRKSGLNSLILNQLSQDISGQCYRVPTNGYVAYSILRSCPDDQIRMKVWAAMHSCSEKQIKRLKQLISLRAVLANLMGRKSFAEYQLDGKMAKTPEQVCDFISTLMDNIKPKAADELKFIHNLKNPNLDKKRMAADSVDGILSDVRPWDRDFYSTVHSIQQRRSAADDEQISSYFTLGTVMEGLSDLFQRIYGIRLEPIIAERGETWSPEVRRLNVVSERDGLIGVVYCDLFERQGKTSNPSHFTICCSRQIYPHELDTSTVQMGRNRDGTRFQLPIISLICNFSSATDSTGKSVCLLQLSEVETLFHEMGHAMHSMLGRTRLQNISGTRCVTDFVELPSILMEHFARDSRVLKEIGRHYETGAPIPDSLLQSHIQESNFMQYCETYSQAKMAMLDQELHSEKIVKGLETLDVTNLYQELERKMKVLVDDKSNWCGKFGHLFGYGATYYSYLFDRAIASKIWDELFSKEPYSRKNGEKFIECVLKWGGSRDPWACIADLFDKPELSKGGTRAMEFIGQAQDL